MTAPLPPGPAPCRDRRHAARRIYRAITLAALLLALVALLPTAWVQRDPLIGIFSLIWMVVPLVIAPALAILALVGSVRLAGDWRYALPAWLYLAAIVVVIVDQLMFSGEAGLWAPAGAILAASLLAAAWAGWWLRSETSAASR